ncbi:IS1634 family transposase [Bacillus kwashiorkori]|uniref:IS1634 family transposase n=1 Tax=Bacillus kwashiorkori TaxID=1522318 RepID=UPI0007825300|nr:IS1634 family transposase [Bacillus kwashiorkori]
MRIKKSVSKNSVSYSVIENVRDINGKSTTKVVEALGNEDEIRAKHPGVDPEEWARAYAKKLTEEKKKEQAPIIAKYHPRKLINKNQRRSYNVGYLFLQSIYYQLGLSQAIKGIQEKYKFQFDLNEILSKLIYMRVLHPTSKKNSFEQAKSLLEGIHCEPHQMYRALDILHKETDFIQQVAYKNSLKLVDRHSKILYYDCTNYYFEIEEEEGYKRNGISKENRPNPIVQMGLFMDASGLPLAFSIFPGNENEQGSLKPLEKRILKDFELSEIIVCTDAGLSSEKNRIYNTLGNRGFITTQSIKKLKKHLKEWVLDPEGWHITAGDKGINLSDIDDSPNNKNTYFKERWIKEGEIEQRLLVTFSPKYKHYQQTIRERQINRALKKIDKPSTLKKKRANDPARFITAIHATKDGEIAEKTHFSIDEAAIQKEAQYDGFYGICTNLESDPKELIRINHKRWEIEETFRVMKSELKSRPVYVKKDCRIEAHFLTCFLALLIYRLLEKRVDEQFTCHEIIQTLREMKMMELSGEGYIPDYERTDITDRLHEVFSFRTDYEIVLTKDIKKILKQTKKGK